MAKRTKKALLSRLDEALQDLYHNATPNHPYTEDESYFSWFEFVAENEIEYIQDGLGMTEKCWKKQIKLGFTHNERYFWLVSRITEFGKLYQWGRGGRTLAPDDLVKQGGGSSFSIRDADYFSDESNARLTEMIQIIEAFNTYVEKWNKSIPEMWKEEQNLAS